MAKNSAQSKPRPKSRYKGVRLRPSGKWSAEIRDPTEGRRWIGSYYSEEEAARAYDFHARKVGFPNSKLNFTDETPPPTSRKRRQAKPKNQPQVPQASLENVQPKDNIVQQESSNGLNNPVNSVTASENLDGSSDWSVHRQELQNNVVREDSNALRNNPVGLDYLETLIASGNLDWSVLPLTMEDVSNIPTIPSVDSQLFLDNIFQQDTNGLNNETGFASAEDLDDSFGWSVFETETENSPKSNTTIPAIELSEFELEMENGTYNATPTIPSLDSALGDDDHHHDLVFVEDTTNSNQKLKSRTIEEVPGASDYEWVWGEFERLANEDASLVLSFEMNDDSLCNAMFENEEQVVMGHSHFHTTRSEFTQSQVQAASKTKISQQLEYFSIEEDNLLVSAWVNTSLDPILGIDSNSRTFWSRITTFYNEHKISKYPERTERSLTGRWSSIQRAMSKFTDFFLQISKSVSSGVTERDKIGAAKVIYQETQKTHFQYEHLWNLLRHQPKWIAYFGQTSKISDSSSSSMPNVINLGEDNASVSKLVELERPMGKKAKKDKRGGEGTSKDSLEVGGTFSELEDEMKFNEETEKEDKEKKKAEEKESKDNRKAHEDKALESLVKIEERRMKIKERRAKIEEERVKLQREKEEMEIMMMDVNTTNEGQKKYIESLQKQILARRMGI